MPSETMELNPDRPPGDDNGYYAAHIKLINETFRRVTGRPLLAVPEAELARAIFNAPFVVASHDTRSPPVFNYANQCALTLWEASWQQFTTMPSSQSAEPVERAERERFLARVSAHGIVEDYTGVRVSTRGRRFRIVNAIVWNVVDDAGLYRGQAVTFSNWEFL